MAGQRRGVELPSEDVDRLVDAIQACPNPTDWKCQCEAHLSLLQTDLASRATGSFPLSFPLPNPPALETPETE